jgi:hypothetical protein
MTHPTNNELEAVERFDLEQPTEHMGSASMDPAPGYGDWVRYSDYAALSAERDDQKKARILAVRSWTEDMVSLTAALEDCSNAEARAEAAEAEVARLRYVLGGVRGAIKTGRNEPLQVWLDQINIALDTTP